MVRVQIPLDSTIFLLTLYIAVLENHGISLHDALRMRILNTFLAISELIFAELDYQLTENLCFKQNWISSEIFATTFLKHLQPRKLLYTYNSTCLVYTYILQR